MNQGKRESFVPPAESAARRSADDGPRSEPVRYADEQDELADVQDQIRALEARLNGMIQRTEVADASEPPPSIREQVSSAAREIVDRLGAPVERPEAERRDAANVLGIVLSADHYLQRWGRFAMRHRSEEVDDFGLDTVYEARVRPLLDFLCKRYFRVEALGVEAIPNEGPCLIVANHSGAIPIDGMMLRAIVRLAHPAGRELRWLAENSLHYLPFVGAFMSRIGAVRACQENARRLLAAENLVAVFPEGEKGISKPYRDRYQLQRFGRGGYIRLCLETRTPLVPCAIVGAEDASPMLYRSQLLGRALGLPYLPLTPTFPALGIAGLIPAPTKWQVAFGDPMSFDDYPPDASADDTLVGKLSERVRQTIQRMLDRGVHQRRSVWFG